MYVCNIYVCIYRDSDIIIKEPYNVIYSILYCISLSPAAGGLQAGRLRATFDAAAHLHLQPAVHPQPAS